MEDFNKEFGPNLHRWWSEQVEPGEVAPSRSWAAIRIAGEQGKTAL